MTGDTAGRRSHARQRATHPERNGAAPRTDQMADADMPTFGATFIRLEETLALLESGDLDLNEAVDMFEHGMRLAQMCQEILDRAELRVSQLVSASEDDGDLTVEAMEFEDD